MKIDRKRNAVTGTMTGILLKLVQIVIPFLIRTIFIRTLGIEYLGLNSLFTSILQVLNLAELGVGSALVFSMYKPIAEDDSGKICQLMNLYRTYYKLIGLVVLGIGLAILPFLPKLISGDVPNDINIYVIYLMNLSATVLSYWLFAYRNSLFLAHQRNDIVNIITIVANMITYLFEIIALLVFTSYYGYLAICIANPIVVNLMTAVASKKYYPEYEPCGKLTKEEKRTINQKVRDLFTAKIGGVVNNSADTIVISAFIGLETVAIYQNYYYIISSLMGVFTIFFNACTAGIGNSLITCSKDKNRELLFNITHITFMAINFCCASLLCLYQPFMRLWVGEEYVLDFSFVILFCIYLFSEEFARPMICFKDAGGIWREDRFRPLTSASVNLVLNLLLVQYIGLYGILISTIASVFFVAFPWLISNINKCLFPIKISRYLVRYAMYALVVVLSSLVSYAVCSLFNFEADIVTLLVRLGICIIVPNMLFLLIFWRTERGKYTCKLIKGFLCNLIEKVSNKKQSNI